MPERNDGGPAFPVSTRLNDDGTYGHQDGATTFQFPGMTLRDWYKAQALKARGGGNYAKWSDLAEDCGDIADAMLAEHDK